jgi:rhodanese-related sulfurtransferase
MTRRINPLLISVLASLITACSGLPDDSAETGSESARDGARPAVVQSPLDSAAMEGEPAAGSEMAPEELVGRLGGESPLVLIDVRTPEEFAAGHIPGAVNIPYDVLPTRLHELEGHQGDEVVVYCRTGRRAGIAEQALTEAGFVNVRDLAGHMVAWTAADYPVSDPSPCC